MRLIDADALIDDVEGVYLYDTRARTAIKRMIRRQPVIEPDSDTVSRQAVLDAIFSEPLYESGMKKRDSDIIVPAIYEKIKALPPSPSRPKGEWIKHIDDLFPMESTIECNICHEEQPLTIDDNFCPNCGADMRS